MLGATTRIVIGAFAVLVLLVGLASIAYGGAAAVSGLWFVVGAAAVLVALAIERNRYRSEAADGTFDTAGPGGGEPSGALEPRFRRTDETFIDPTTGVIMRVFVDRSTGERRYVGEGRA
jgi:hypothetical protein